MKDRNGRVHGPDGRFVSVAGALSKAAKGGHSRRRGDGVESTFSKAAGATKATPKAASPSRSAAKSGGGGSLSTVAAKIAPPAAKKPRTSRIMADDNNRDLETLTADELRAVAKREGINVSGRKGASRRTLVGDLMHGRNMRRSGSGMRLLAGN